MTLIIKCLGVSDVLDGAGDALPDMVLVAWMSMTGRRGLKPAKSPVTGGRYMMRRAMRAM